MSRMIQIRNVPEDLHRALRVRAAQAGTSLSDYLLAELRRIAELPTRACLLARISSRPSVHMRPKAAEAVRAERERR